MIAGMGRPFGTKRIESPEELGGLFDEYVAWTESNKWYKNDFIKSGEFAGQIVRLPIDRPLTEWEFATYCGLSYQGLRNYGEAEGYETYFDIYAHIKTKMQAQRISGGLVDAFNANLVARIDGIKEKTEQQIEQTGKMEVVFNVPRPVKKSTDAD